VMDSSDAFANLVGNRATERMWLLN
jgi:hypothetical protein